MTTVADQKLSPILASQSFHARPVTDQNGVVRALTIETSDYLVLTQDPNSPLGSAQHVPPTASLTVYGDVVAVAGPISLPGQQVTIFCRRLDAMPDGNGHAAAVSVDGADPTDGVPLRVLTAAQGQPGENGSGAAGWSAKDHPEMDGQKGGTGLPGNAGGSITIVCGDIGTPFDLSLSARGGRGGNGTRGQDGGTGGTGGTGRDAQAKSWQVQLANAAAGDTQDDIEPPTKGGNGGDGGRAGDGGDAGCGGSGGTIDVSILNADPMDYLASTEQWITPQPPWRSAFSITRRGGSGWLQGVVECGANGVPGDPGERGAFGIPGPGGRGMTLKTGGGLFSDEQAVLAHVDEASPGSFGNAGGTGSAGALLGNPPQPGAADCRFAAVAASRLKQQPSATQLAMLFRDACTHYLAAGDNVRPAELDEARERLGWLQDRLTSIPPGPEHDALADLDTSVNGLLLNLMQGRNYFGQTPTYAPRASLDFLSANVTQTLATLQSLESSAKTYTDKLAASTATNDDLQLVLAHNTACVEYWRKQASDTGDRLTQLIAEIEAADAELPAARDALKNASDRFEEAIKDSTGLQPEDALDCIEQLSFAGGESPQSALMAVAQAGKLYNKSVNYVTDDTGESYRKDYITHSLALFGRDVSNLSEAWHAAKDQRAQLDDPNAYRLLIAQEDFDKVCDQFYSKLGDATKARLAMADLVELVQNRNAKIADYNTGIGALADLNSRIAHAQREKSALDGQLAKNAAPDLALVGAFVGGLYEHVKAHCTRQLYVASRALELWALTPCRLFSDVLQGKFPADLDHDTLSAAWDDLSGKLEDAVEQLAAPSQTFPAEADSVGVPVWLSKVSSGALERLKKSGACTFRLRAPTKKTTVDETFFAGKADVRITIVRAWLLGVRPHKRLVQVQIHHVGDEEITRCDGTCVEFSHVGVDRGFTYDGTVAVCFSDDGSADGNLLGAVTAAGTEDGKIEEPPGTKVFAQIGPFARWRIVVPRQLNTDLDLSTLTDVVLEFHGGNQMLPLPAQG